MIESTEEGLKKLSDLQTYVLEKKAPNPKLRKKCTEDA